jgi:hypothetical protein
MLEKDGLFISVGMGLVMLAFWGGLYFRSGAF